MSYIYKITNKINNKSYIGKTLSSIEKRWKQHLSARNRSNHKNRALYKAFNKYGIENFYIEQIEVCSTDVINEREQYWIQYFNTFHFGYNVTRGGDGKAYLDTTLVLSLWKDNKSITEINELTSYGIDSIRKILDNNGITLKDRIKRGRVKYIHKPLIMLSKEGNKIKEFNSVQEAQDYLNITRSGHISDVCNGKRKSAYGYKWCWK